MHYLHSSGLGVIRRERGAALILAMLVFALAAALVVAMKSEFDRFYQRSANLLLEEQAQAYLRGAEDLATLVLLADYDQDKLATPSRDDLNETWYTPPGTPPPTYTLDEGWMRGTLEDLQGRFNLNRLAKRAPAGTGTIRFTAAQEQFIRLLQALGEPEVTEGDAILITESVSDWLDPDLQPSQDGAEDDHYSGLTPAYRTGNQLMSSVSELRAVANMTPQIYQALLPWVTVLPDEKATLNIHTAPATVLRSINATNDRSPLSEADGEALVEYRKETGFADKADFFANPVFAGTAGDMAAISGELGERSRYFLLQAEVEVAGRNMRLYSVLERGNRTISAIARASGSL